jgi:hypothetical protein
MNENKLPGFTAHASLYEKGSRYRSEATGLFANGTKVNEVHMQKPNSQNTAGGSCYGFTSGTLIKGTYDSLGRCCTYPPKGFPFCIDCDVDKCYDRQLAISGGFTLGNIQGGVFTRF